MLIPTSLLHAQSGSDDYWKSISENEIKSQGTRQIVPDKYLSYRLDIEELKSILAGALHESEVKINESKTLIYLPAPNGQLQAFRVVEAPVMETELGEAYPHIKTYSLKGLDDVYANGKLDLNDFGLHAMIRSVRGDFFIDPYANDTRSEYITYYKTDFTKNPEHIIPETGVLKEDSSLESDTSTEEIKKKNEFAKTGKTAAVCVGDRLRTYRLAVACTGEYAIAATGLPSPTKSQVLSRVTTTVNRVNGVYESELSVRLVLIANDTLILFTNPSTDPFNGNNNSGTLIQESQTVINSNIGPANYDIGHTFSTGGGGLAQLGCVCTSQKARGVTGSASPVGDPYDIDYVAHEIGHQFGGNHTFNASTGSCSGNRNASTSMEPGSGITIMGYAGLCSSNNLGNNSIAFFHAVSYDEMIDFTHSGSGNNCVQNTTTGNNAPVVSLGNSYTIPKLTAFELTGSATDADGDALVYSWEGFNRGLTAGNWNSGTVPYFRSYAPDTSGYRMFPRLNVVLGGSTTGTRGEYYPQSAQSLNFRFTARDGKMGGGGVCSEGITITVSNDGPFKVTHPNTSGIVWYQEAWPVVTWDMAGTDVAPITCDKVNILISTDGGINFSMLVADTDNDGSESVLVPAVSQNVNNCRLRIECANNIFFDINDANFSISTLVSTEAQAGIPEIYLNIHPNPSDGFIQIDCSIRGNSTQNEIRVMDLLGRILLLESFEGNQLKKTLDLQSYPAGIYNVEIRNAEGKVQQKVVKH